MTIAETNLIRILGIESLPDEQKADILDSASTLIQQRLLLRLMKQLDDQKREELASALKSVDKKKFTAFMNKECPNYFDWMEEEALALKEELKSLGEQKE